MADTRIVALAGTSTGVGRCIAESILKRGGTIARELRILSRHPIDIPAFSGHVHIVDYTAPDSESDDPAESLIAALTGVHTVISAIGGHIQSGRAQVALVKAAVAAGVVRFVPSGWSATNAGPQDVIELYRFQAPAIDALRTSGLQWSFPANGIFINYLATPKAAAIGPLKPLKFWIDIENRKATIPGDGTKQLVYTTVEDVGEFVAKALEECWDREWPNPLTIVGAHVTHRQLVQYAEKALGGEPFEVVYKNEGQLKSELVPNPPSVYVNLTTQLSLAILEDRFTFQPTSKFGDLEFTPPEFTQPEAFINKWWGGAQ
ncbi:hypothetical protein DFH07DRAFT_928375 [Mycena maculata]|uniref:NmrA-like domain-containing protein n=1 Tax=Mycena maculata TaxID=230809 RepID=A0AAD7I5Y5_9AGAR|nr:hypothetical protein DFH07DRAFT_928375 [Mycena maculata]